MQQDRQRLEELRARARLEELRARRDQVQPHGDTWPPGPREDRWLPGMPARGDVRRDAINLLGDPIGTIVSGGARMIDRAIRQDGSPAEIFADELPASQMLLQGATFGAGDELMGAAAGLGSMAGGGNYGEAYRENTDAARAGLARNREVAPVTSFALEAAGGGAVALPGARQFIGGASSRMGLMGRSAAVGAGTGGVVGFAEDEGSVRERLDGAGLGAAGGAVIGGATPLAIEGGGRLALGLRRAAARAWRNMRNGDSLTRNQRRAWDRALQSARDAGISEQELLGRLNDLERAGMADEQTIAEVLGEQAIFQARGGVASGNANALSGRQRMNARQARQPERVRGYLRQGVGSDGSEFDATRQRLNQATARENELYDAFRDQPAIDRTTLGSNNSQMGSEQRAYSPGQNVSDYYSYDRLFDDINSELSSDRFIARSGASESSYYQFPFSDEIGVTRTLPERNFEVRFSSHDNYHPKDGVLTLEVPITIIEQINEQYGPRGVADAIADLDDAVRPVFASARERGLREGVDAGLSLDDDIDEIIYEYVGEELAGQKDNLTEIAYNLLREWTPERRGSLGQNASPGALQPNRQLEATTLTTRLQDFLQNPRFRRIAREAARDVTDTRGGRVPDIDEGNFSPELVDAIKRRMDDLISDAESGAISNTAVSRPLRQLRDRWVALADEAFPNYAPARAEAQIRLSAREALEEGRNIFRTENVRNPEQLARMVQGMTDQQRQAFRQGVARGVVDQINAAPRNVIVAGGVPIQATRDASNPISRFWNRADRQEALRAAFGDEANFRRFVERLAIESDRADTFRQVSTRTQGSPTQGNQAAANMASGLDAVGDAAEAVGGNPIGVALRSARRLLQRNNGGWTPEVEAELQRILWSTVPQERARLLRALRNQNLITEQQAVAIRFARENSANVSNAVIEGSLN